jgi:hypothetical protein
MTLRRGLAEVPEDRLRDVLESNLLARTLRGAELLRFDVGNRDDHDSPLVITMGIRVPRFAQTSGPSLVVTPPLSPELGRLATLPARRTPLLLSEALNRSIDLRIELPPGATIPTLAPKRIEDGARRVTLDDTAENGVLRIRRSIAMPAARVTPDDYGRFARFVHQADDALSRSIRIDLR